MNPINPIIDETGLCMAIDGESLAGVLPNLGTGSPGSEDGVFPFPRIYKRATAEQQSRRDDELAQAKLNNFYNDTALPGAVIHGNPHHSQEALANGSWEVRGTEEERSQHAREDNLGLDDSNAGEDSIDMYESMFYYLEKNCELWATNDGAVTNVQQLLTVLTDAVLSDVGVARITMVDPVIAFAPASRPNDIKYYDFYPEAFPQRYPKQPFDQDFRDDDVVAWVQTAHSSPFHRLKPYTEHLNNFSVTNEHFRRTEAFQNDDLDQAMADGRVFIVNYADFNEFNLRTPSPGSQGARLYTAMALFAVPKHSDGLKVVAIQSTQDTPRDEAERRAWKENNTQDADRPLSDILTPADDYWSWQMAKTLFLSMYAMSSVVDHLSMHVYLGAVPVGFYRNIPRQHPLSALVLPHMHGLVGNNWGGIFGSPSSDIAMDAAVPRDDTRFGRGDRGILTGAIERVSGWSGQTFLDAAVKISKRYEFVEHSTPEDRNQNKRFSAIGDFPLLDDSGIYPILKEWVSNYLKLYYRNDADVVHDHELQAFCYETANDGQVKGFPAALNSIDDMIDMVTRLIYWMSNNHALEATLSCIKLAPLSYWSDRVPRNDEVKQESDWFDIMPPINVGLGIFCASRLFVDLPRDWFRSLGRYPEGNFMHDRRIYTHLETLQQRMMGLEAEIAEKNEARRWPYSMMRPSTMTCSPWN